MKKLFLIFLILFLSSNYLSAQSISISEMIEGLKCEDFNCFHNLIITKGFTYTQNMRSNTEPSYFFKSDTDPKTNVNFSQAPHYLEVGISTQTKDFYIDNVNSLQKLSFKKGGTRNLNFPKIGDDKVTGIEAKYYSEQYPNIFVSFVVKTHSSKSAGRFTVYNVYASTTRN